MIKYIAFSCILISSGVQYPSNAVKAPKTAVPGVTQAEIKKLADKLESEMKAKASASANAQSTVATNNASSAQQPKTKYRVYCDHCEHYHTYE